MLKKTATQFSPEVRGRAVRRVPEHQGEHASQGATIRSIACTRLSDRTAPGRRGSTQTASGNPSAVQRRASGDISARLTRVAGMPHQPPTRQFAPANARLFAPVTVPTAKSLI